jgi:hypothetical protein
MVARQLPIDLPFNPHSGFMVLAGGAVTIAARSEDSMRTCAFIALVNHHAVMIRAAIDDGIDDFEVFIGYLITEAPDILGGMGMEDVFNCCHGQILSLYR